MLIMRFLIIAMLMLLASHSHANDEADAKLSKYLNMRKKMSDNLQITPVAGFNAIGFQDNTVSVNGQTNNYKSEPENGSTLGVLVDYNTKFYGIGLQTGLLYNRYVSAFTLVTETSRERLEYTDSYLSIPIAIKIYPFSRAGQWLYFKGGASMNALLDSQQTVTRTNTEPLNPFKANSRPRNQKLILTFREFWVWE